MASEIIYVTGIGKWVKVYESQMDTKYGEKFSVVLYPDEASINTLKAAGCRKEAKEDEDGVFYKFDRDNRKMMKGEEVLLGPPKVLSADASNEPFTSIIGNGSKLTCKLVIYDTPRGKGTRLEAVRVDDLVPYEGTAVDPELYPF